MVLDLCLERNRLHVGLHHGEGSGQEEGPERSMILPAKMQLMYLEGKSCRIDTRWVGEPCCVSSAERPLGDGERNQTR